MKDRLKTIIPNVLYGPDNLPKLVNYLEEYEEPLFERYSSNPQNPFHCFVDDWRLEAIWRDPTKFVEKALIAGTAIAPDFSAYAGFPYFYTMYQIWRSRVICAWWLAHGVYSIPVLQWTHYSDPYLDNYFEGLEYCDVIAVRCPPRDQEIVEDYLRCAERFLKHHKPKLILHFGCKRGSEAWPNCKILPLNPKQKRPRYVPVSRNKNSH